MVVWGLVTLEKLQVTDLNSESVPYSQSATLLHRCMHRQSLLQNVFFSTPCLEIFKYQPLASALLKKSPLLISCITNVLARLASGKLSFQRTVKKFPQVPGAILKHLNMQLMLA